MKKHLDILESEVKKLKQNKNVKGVLLIGSVAYGMATDNSDLDLIVISNENKFVSEYVDGILVGDNFSRANYMIDTIDWICER